MMRKRSMLDIIYESPDESESPLKLIDGSRVGVIGGGPAGSFFSIFLRNMAHRIDLDVQIDVYEPRTFAATGPAGCNHCGGIISETLVQMLATEGIRLPADVVQRGIDSYVLHMDVGTVRVDTPLHEMRIGAVHRGAGPMNAQNMKWNSFDGFLQNLCLEKGANLIRDWVQDISWHDGYPQVQLRNGPTETYDLLAIATGVNAASARLLKSLNLAYQPPQMTKTMVCEYLIGEETINQYLGSAMHVFLLHLPGLKFAAAIPKGDYVTMCLLGENLDKDVFETFLNSPEVNRCMPPGWQANQSACRCVPRMNIGGAVHPYADRIVFIGDCAVTRLYKDGIGGAYRAAKAAAATAVFQGIAEEDFRKHYWPICQNMARDNAIGDVIFVVARVIQGLKFSRQAVLRMARDEQDKTGNQRCLSMILWNMFTGSASYRDILLCTLHPAYLQKFFRYLVGAAWSTPFAVRSAQAFEANEKDFKLVG